MDTSRAACRSILATALALITCCCHVDNGKGDDDIASSLLLSIKDGREHLRTGIFRMRGQRVRIAADGTAAPEQFEAFCAFDLPAERLRFDRWEEGWPRALPEGNRLFLKFAKTPSECVVSDPSSRVVLTGERVERTPEYGKIAPFDVRVLGLVGALDIARGVSFADVMAGYTDANLSEAVKEDGGYRLTWVYGDPPRAKRDLWVDPTSGFTPTRLAISGRPADAASPWGDPHATVVVKWAIRDDVSVPEQVVEKYVFPTWSLLYEMNFEWELINAPVASSFFSLPGLEADERALVVHPGNGKHIVLGRVGNYPSFAVGDRVPRSFRALVFATAVILALVLVVTYYIGHRMRAWKVRGF